VIDETRLAAVLREAADTTETDAPPTDRVLWAGHRLRRRCRAARSAALASTVVLACALGGAIGLGSRTAIAPAAAPTLHDSTPAPGARVVSPGQPTPVPPSGVLRLSEKGVSFTFGPQSPIDSGGTWTLDVGEVPQGGLQGPGFGSSKGSVYFGIYRGPGTLARMVATLQGRPMRTQVLTLPGHPGWAAYLAVGPGDTGNGPVALSFTGYDATGAVLARHDLG
jgi:hypothetical protein